MLLCVVLDGRILGRLSILLGDLRILGNLSILLRDLRILRNLGILGNLGILWSLLILRNLRIHTGPGTTNRPLLGPGDVSSRGAEICL